MKQDLEVSQIQYLMIFLRRMPSEGLEEFQRQLLNVAIYTPEGTNRSRPYQAYIGRDTKSKILVSGETPLDQGNLLAGFIMTFPQLDLASAMISIQKFSLKGDSRAESEEAGAIVVAENWGFREIRWDLPGEYDLRKKEDGMLKGFTSKDTHKKPRDREVHVFTSFKNQADPSDDRSQAGLNGENDPQEIMNIIGIDEGVKESNDVDEGFASEGGFLDDDSDFRGFLKATDPLEDAELDETSQPVDRMKRWSLEDFEAEPIESHPQRKVPAFIDFPEEADGYEDISFNESSEVGRKKQASPFAEETNASEYSDTHPTFGRSYSDRYESSAQAYQKAKEFEQPNADEEDLYESETENAPRSPGSFTLLGTMEDDDQTEAVWASNADQISASVSSAEDLIQGKAYQNNIDYQVKRSLQEQILDRIRDLPIRKFFTILMVIGGILIAISLGVKALEPDLEAARKAAGITDIYEWIIANDLVGTNTEDWSRLWKNSPEYRQYWAWHDNQWSKTISRYHTIEGGFTAIGVMAFVSGMAIFLLSSFLRAKPAFNKGASAQIGSIERKRISLSFFADIDVWPIIDTWTKINDFRLLETEGPRRLYRKSGNMAHPPIMCMLSNSDGDVQLEVWLSTRIPTFLMPIFTDLGIEVLESKKGRLPEDIHEAANLLLESFGQNALL